MDRAMVDQSCYTAMGLDVEPVIADSATGAQAVNAQQQLKWKYAAWVTEIATGRKDAVKIGIVGPTPPDAMVGQMVRFLNLRVQYWAQSGRSGLAWTADGVEAAAPVGRRSES